MTQEPLNLEKEGEWAGLWWLPSARDEQVPGTLRYTPDDGLRLTLIGAFEDRIMSTPSPGMQLIHEGRQTWDVIHGVAEQREITLLNCVPVQGKRTHGARVQSSDKQTVKAISALIGVHADCVDESLFSSVAVSVENLGFWGATSKLETRLGAADGRLDGTGSISLNPLEPSSVEVDGVEFTLSHRSVLPFIDRRRGDTVAQISDTSFVKIVPREPSSVSEAIDFARLIQDLVALATHRAAGVFWVQLVLAPDNPNHNSDNYKLDPSVELIYSPSVVGKSDAKAVQHHHVLFTCDTLPFNEVMPRWYDMHGRLQPSTNMVLGLRYSPAQYVENNLLTAVGAAEVLHRGLDIDESPIPKDDFRRIRDAMLAVVPQKYLERIRSSLRNAPTLRDRLKALAARPDQEAMSRLVPDVDKWAERATRARNDLAHEGLTPKHSFEELIAVVEVTNAVVVLNLLNELGLSAERQREIVKDNPQLRATARQSHEYLYSDEP